MSEDPDGVSRRAFLTGTAIQKEFARGYTDAKTPSSTDTTQANETTEETSEAGDEQARSQTTIEHLKGTIPSIPFRSILGLTVIAWLLVGAGRAVAIPTTVDQGASGMGGPGAMQTSAIEVANCDAPVDLRETAHDRLNKLRALSKHP